MASNEEIQGLMRLSAAIMTQLRRDGRFPTRLDEEDYEDIASEGTLAGLQLLVRFDPDRGSMRAFMGRAIVRAQLAFAWKQAQVGITGGHTGVQVWSTDAPEHDEGEFDQQGTRLDEINEAMASPDVAAEIEAFDHIWRTRYIISE